jgi:hypothetical protein
MTITVKVVARSSVAEFEREVATYRESGWRVLAAWFEPGRETDVIRIEGDYVITGGPASAIAHHPSTGIVPPRWCALLETDR